MWAISLLELEHIPDILNYLHLCFWNNESIGS